jgi:hypothetical protein
MSQTEIILRPWRRMIPKSFLKSDRLVRKTGKSEYIAQAPNSNTSMGSRARLRLKTGRKASKVRRGSRYADGQRNDQAPHAPGTLAKRLNS